MAIGNKGKIKIQYSGDEPRKLAPYSNDVLYDAKGQYKFPGQITKIPSGSITMDNIPYPVKGVDNMGNSQIMYPDNNYYFPGADTVIEYPQFFQQGGSNDFRDLRPTTKDTSMEMLPTYLSSYEYAMSQMRDLTRHPAMIEQLAKQGTPKNLPSKKLQQGGPTPDKAERMLHDNSANGKPLSPAQKRYFGMLAHPKHQTGGMTQDNTYVPSRYSNQHIEHIPSSADIDQTQGNIFDLPRIMMMKGLTGKAQNPSEALGIQNKWGKMIADNLLDPTNYIGMGEASKVMRPLSNTEKVLAKSHPNAGTGLWNYQPEWTNTLENYKPREYPQTPNRWLHQPEERLQKEAYGGPTNMNYMKNTFSRKTGGMSNPNQAEEARISRHPEYYSQVESMAWGGSNAANRNYYTTNTPPSMGVKFGGDTNSEGTGFKSPGEDPFEDKKNAFLGWLKNTSMDALHKEMIPHAIFYNQPDGSIASHAELYPDDTAGMNKKGGFNKYKEGNTYDVSDQELEQLRQQGYQFNIH